MVPYNTMFFSSGHRVWIYGEIAWCKVDFPKWPFPTSLCIFGGQTDKAMLFCKLNFLCINTLHGTQLCIYDHASITILTMISGGHCRLLHGNDYSPRKISCCAFLRIMYWYEFLHVFRQFAIDWVISWVKHIFGLTTQFNPLLTVPTTGPLC